MRVAAEPTWFHRNLGRVRANYANETNLVSVRRRNCAEQHERRITTAVEHRANWVLCAGLVRRRGKQGRGIETQTLFVEWLTTRYIS